MVRNYIGFHRLASIAIRLDVPCRLVMPLMDKGSCYYILRMMKKAGRVPEGQGLHEDVIATIIREVLQVRDIPRQR
jgi:hypothetical protein